MLCVFVKPSMRVGRPVLVSVWNVLSSCQSCSGGMKTLLVIISLLNRNFPPNRPVVTIVHALDHPSILSRYIVSEHFRFSSVTISHSCCRKEALAHGFAFPFKFSHIWDRSPFLALNSMRPHLSLHSRIRLHILEFNQGISRKGLITFAP